ncbi:hypothetical protein SAMN05216167_106333 [Spirosoma endophyticum]|uniref:Uncharacterized protein n=1 Tax=Spirosoma endophyticum TaxID=662367 RepID=A0A1I1UN97_9BACT|nr:hypothetical protein SAMN05216167_106333 [Spirosoma endophyticum]
METPVRNALTRLWGIMSLSWHITVFTVKYVLIKSRNLKLFTYREDVFVYWIWRWHWRWDATHKQWTASRLRAYCPVCQSKLNAIKNDHSILLICPKGGRTHEKFNTKSETSDKIKLLLLEKAARQFNLSEQ